MGAATPDDQCIIEMEADGLDERLGFEGLAATPEVSGGGSIGDVERTLGNDGSLV